MKANFKSRDGRANMIHRLFGDKQELRVPVTKDFLLRVQMLDPVSQRFVIAREFFEQQEGRKPTPAECRDIAKAVRG